MDSSDFDSNQTADSNNFTFEYSNISTTSTDIVPDRFKASFLIMLILFSTIGNSLCTMVVKRSHNLHTPSRNFMMHLCKWNLFCGVLAPSSAYGCWMYGKFEDINPHVCSVIAFVDTYTFSISMWLLMVITVDKWILLSFPLQYRSIMTKKTSKSAIIVLYIILLAYSIPIVGNVALESNFDVDMWICEPQWNQNEIYNYFYVFTVFVPSFLIMLVLNIYIFCTAIYQIKKIQKFQVGDQSTVRLAVLKAGLNVSVVIFVYYLTFTPVASMYIIEFFNITKVHSDVKFFLFWFSYIHYCICCILYTALNKELKEEVKKLFRCCLNDSRMVSDPMNVSTM